MAPISSAKKALIVLLAVSLFNYVDRSLLSILQVSIKGDLGFSDAQLGALTGLSFALFYATAALPLARLVDRHRRTLIMALSLLVWTSMTALSSFATGFASLIALRIGVALGEAGSVPATHSLLSDYFPPNRRATAFALWSLAPPLGAMLGVFCGGWLEHEIGWRGSFETVGLTGLTLVPVLLLLREPQRGRFDPPSLVRQQDRSLSMPAAAKMLWNLRSFRYLVAAGTLQSFSYTALFNWLPSFYARVHHLPLSQVAIWSALMIGIGGGAGSFAGGAIVDQLVRRDLRWYAWAPGLAILLSVPVCVVQCLVGNPSISIALGFATIFLGSFFVAPINATAQSLVSPLLRGFTAAVLLLIPTVLGLGLGPFLTGVLSDVLARDFALGDQSLRYAIILVLQTSLIAGVIYFRNDQNLLHDWPSRNNVSSGKEMQTIKSALSDLHAS